MTIISSLIEEVRANLNEDASVVSPFYSNSEIINYVRRSYNDICIDTDSNFRVFGTATSGSSVGTITVASAGTTTTFTLANHGLVTSEVVYISGITGTMASSINDSYQYVNVLGASTFYVDIDTTGMTYSSGGTTLNMVYGYTFSSIGGASSTALLDLREIAYLSNDTQTVLYENLPRTNLKDSLNSNVVGNLKQTCMIENDTIILTRYPHIGDIILVAGRWLPIAITTSGDAYPLGAIEEDASIKYATALCWFKKNKPEIGTAWMGLYNDRKNDIKLKKAKLTETTYPSGLTVIKDRDSLLRYNRIPTITP